MAALVIATSVMLAAGGTGGHLFPAFALAQELARRGIAVDLVTDMRGDRYDADFPARAVYRVPSATLGGQARSLAPAAGGLDARCAALPPRSSSWARSGPARVVGFGGYPAFPPLVAARLRRHSHRPARAERRAGAGQPLARRPRDRHCHLVRADQAPGRPALAKRAHHRQPGARPGGRLGDPGLPAAAPATDRSRCWCSAAARARASSPTCSPRRWP